MPVPLIAAKKGLDLVRAARQALAQWNDLPAEERQLARQEADRVKQLSAELARALRDRAIDRGRTGEAQARDARAITNELADALRRLGAAMPDTGMRRSRTMRAAAFAVSRVGRGERPPPEPSSTRPRDAEAKGDAMTDAPPLEFQETERLYGDERRELRGDDAFWDVVPETVEWKEIRDGGRLDIPRVREEYIEFAWPDGRAETVGEKPRVLMIRKYDSFFPQGRTEATRDPNRRVEDLPVRELYARCDPPPRWIGRLRQEQFRPAGQDARTVRSFESYVVVEEPSPRSSPLELEKTMDRQGGSLEGTGFVDWSPPPTRRQQGSGLLRRLRGG
jgi:hypothetical protein